MTDGAPAPGITPISADSVADDVLKPTSQDDLIAARLKALQALLDEGQEHVPKFRIEVIADKHKTNRGAFPGIVLVFRTKSGTRGEADEILYPCPDSRCKGYITPDDFADETETAFCSKCERAWPVGELRETTFYRLPPEKWAFVLAREVLRTNCDAEVRLRLTGTDLREKNRLELTNKGGEALHSARADRITVVYAFKDMLRDVSTGSSLEARLLSLVRA